MNDENRDYVQSLAKKLEEKYGSEVVEIFYEYFSAYIERALLPREAADKAYEYAEKNALEDETLTRMG